MSFYLKKLPLFFHYYNYFEIDWEFEYQLKNFLLYNHFYKINSFLNTSKNISHYINKRYEKNSFEQKRNLNKFFENNNEILENIDNNLNDILGEIKKNNNINIKEKQSLIELIPTMLSFIKENRKLRDKIDFELNRLCKGFLCLQQLVKTIFNQLLNSN